VDTKLICFIHQGVAFSFIFFAQIQEGPKRIRNGFEENG